jgi:hypothetical protein
MRFPFDGKEHDATTFGIRIVPARNYIGNCLTLFVYIPGARNQNLVDLRIERNRRVPIPYVTGLVGGTITRCVRGPGLPASIFHSLMHFMLAGAVCKHTMRLTKQAWIDSYV